MPYCMKCFNEKEKKNYDIMKLVFTDEVSVCENCGQRKKTVVRVKDSKNIILLIIVLTNLILWPTLIYLLRNAPARTAYQPVYHSIPIPEKQVDYQKLLSDNTKTLNAGEHIFQDKFKDTSLFKVKPINPKTSGNFTVYDAEGNLVTNEILGDNYGVRECITFLDTDYEIKISGIDRVQFSPIIMGSKQPVYENKNLIPGYHLVGHTVAAGKSIITAKKGSGNFFVYRGNSVEVNEIFDKDIGISSYEYEFQDDDLIYTSGVEIALKIK